MRELRSFAGMCGEASRAADLAVPAGPGRAALAKSVAIAVLIAGLAGTSIWPPPLTLVWNASASSPMGLYRVGSAHEVQRGDRVVAWAPDEARELGAARHYLPRNVPLVKRVAATEGDHVCAVGAMIFVNGRRIATRRRTDPSGRPMPWWWRGCERLRGGDVLLLSPGAPEAFDGRYFGITRSAKVLGRAKLLWLL